jgi:uncharacterized membrane protein HdeD (DUF308 family)
MGLLALTVAPIASLAMGLYLGILLCIVGGIAAVGGFANVGRRGALLAALLGVLCLFVGVAVLFNPAVGAVTLIWLLGAWLIVGGVLELGMAFLIPLGRIWLFLLGAINLALGSLLVTMNPGAAFLLLGYLVGISFVLRGSWSLVFVGRAHHIEKVATQVAAT